MKNATISLLFTVFFGCTAINLSQFNAPPTDDSNYPRISVFFNTDDLHKRRKTETTIAEKLKQYQVRPVTSIDFKESDKQFVDQILIVKLVKQFVFNVDEPGASVSSGSIAVSPYGNLSYFGATRHRQGSTFPVVIFQYQVRLFDVNETSTSMIWSMTVGVTSLEDNIENEIAEQIGTAMKSDKILEIRPSRFVLWGD